jgi:hypothetical protein
MPLTPPDKYDKQGDLGILGDIYANNLGTACEKDTGTDDSEVPTNNDLKILKANALMFNWAWYR